MADAEKVRPDLRHGQRGGHGNQPRDSTASKYHDELVASYEKLIPLAADAGIKNVICFSGNRERPGRRAGDRELRQGPEAADVAGGKQTGQRGDGAAQQQGQPQGLHVRPHRLGRRAVQAVGSERFKLLYDIYHMQIMEGDMIRTIRENAQYIAHYHTGGIPGATRSTRPRRSTTRPSCGRSSKRATRGSWARNSSPRMPTHWNLCAVALRSAMCDLVRQNR